jgi:asparagine synthase (glutamine-hydrolysing)
MSVQFGKWSFDGMPPLFDFLEKVDTVLAPYGPDNSNSYHKGGVSVLYRAFYTTRESRRETQPHISQSGTVIAWDGRLDNRADLIHRFSSLLSVDSADVSIVAAAFDLWGIDCFAKLIGDWTLSIWNPNQQALILAKDPIGTRHLYYSVHEGQVVWSTILDPLVLFAGRTFTLNEEYIAGWFSSFPAAHLTPYVGIDSVPPSCFVRLERGRRTISKYWDFDSGKRIRYRTDAEYEEHFRTVFAEAVQRRLRSDRPILAELSGGMDSSSIVCMADTIIAQGAAETPRLDTLSYYNDSEPNWNERPFFTKVEEKRGRVGCHIDLDAGESFRFEFEKDTFAATPGSGEKVSDAAKQFAAYLTAHENRVVLSGIGGDEVMGGVPTPLPELMDLIARARFMHLVHQLKLWALEKRKPWFHLLFETMRGFFPRALVGLPEQMRPAPWLQQEFVGRHLAALTGYPARVKLFGPMPSFQESVFTFDGLRRLLASSVLSPKPQYEKRFPYLDRDLLEFLFAIPREQLVRPGQRRSLMRRALIDIVPSEVLHRKRKAFACRALLTNISCEWTSLVETCQHLESASLGVVDTHAFCGLLQEARHGRAIPIVTLVRTLGVESWLRRLRCGEPSKNYTFEPPLCRVTERQAPSRLVPDELSQANQSTRG